MSPALTAGYDELIGAGRWSAPVNAGDAGAVRFPSQDRGDAGYHIEGSYHGPDGQPGWVNIRSRGRGLLALFLFTDVGPDDAPTRLICGSHLAVPEFLAPYGQEGTSSDTDFWYPLDAVPARRARDRLGRGRVPVPPVHRARLTAANIGHMVGVRDHWSRRSQTATDRPRWRSVRA